MQGKEIYLVVSQQNSFIKKQKIFIICYFFLIL